MDVDVDVDMELGWLSRFCGALACVLRIIQDNDDCGVQSGQNFLAVQQNSSSCSFRYISGSEIDRKLVARIDDNSTPSRETRTIRNPNPRESKILLFSSQLLSLSSLP